MTQRDFLSCQSGSPNGGRSEGGQFGLLTLQCYPQELRILDKVFPSLCFFSVCSVCSCLNSLAAATAALQCYSRELRIFGKIFRIVLLNDK
jgi:hypothetical protein